MIRRPPRVTRTDTLFPTRRSSDLRRALKRLLDSPAALAVAWFVVVALLASVGAWAFLQPPPPAGGEAVTIAVELIASPAEPPAEPPAAAPTTTTQDEAGPAEPTPRAEERRVGKEVVRRGRQQW